MQVDPATGIITVSAAPMQMQGVQMQGMQMHAAATSSSSSSSSSSASASASAAADDAGCTLVPVTDPAEIKRLEAEMAEQQATQQAQLNQMNQMNVSQMKPMNLNMMMGGPGMIMGGGMSSMASNCDNQSDAGTVVTGMTGATAPLTARINPAIV